MPLQYGMLIEISANFTISGRKKNMKFLYREATSMNLSEGQIYPLEVYQQVASQLASNWETNVLDPILDNFPVNVFCEDFILKCPQRLDLYHIRPIGLFGRGSTAGGDHLGNRVFYTIRSNKGHIDINRKIHHITGVYENAQNDGKVTPAVVTAIQGTWNAILTLPIEVSFMIGTEMQSNEFLPYCVEHVKTLKNKDDGTEYFAYELPTQFTGYAHFPITNFSCKDTWKQFDK